MEIPFEELDHADLAVDAVYKGGTKNKNLADEVLHILLPKCGNSGGFRKVKRQDGSGKIAYVVLYTSMQELEWPDYLDKETGIFRYYGDNRKPGKGILDTPLKGNELLEKVFNRLNEAGPYDDIPPFLLFKKEGAARDVKFLGLAAPGNRDLSSDKDLVAFWRTMNGNRFQNYEAYFTVLDTGKMPVSRQWLDELIYDHSSAMEHAPLAWKRFVRQGRNGIAALRSPKILAIPSSYEQLQSDNEGMHCVKMIYQHYDRLHYFQGFEACARDLVMKMDPHFEKFDLTRPWRDGGRDAVGYYAIKQPADVNHCLRMECSLEAKCYNPGKTTVGVHEMSRLISRIRYRQFGIMVTTSCVDKQAYEEVVEDGHPILILTAADIASILRSNAINTSNIENWLNTLDDMDQRVSTYSSMKI